MMLTASGRPEEEWGCRRHGRADQARQVRHLLLADAGAGDVTQCDNKHRSDLGSSRHSHCRTSQYSGEHSPNVIVPTYSGGQHSMLRSHVAAPSQLSRPGESQMALQAEATTR